MDFGLEVTFQYLTTGEADIGSALIETGKGLINPAKTYERARDVARITAKELRRMQRKDFDRKREQVLKRDNNTCTYCGKDGSQVDHKTSVAEEAGRVNAGEKTADQAARDLVKDENLTTACPACNGPGEKGTTPLSREPSDGGWVPPLKRDKDRL